MMSSPDEEYRGGSMSHMEDKFYAESVNQVNNDC